MAADVRDDIRTVDDHSKPVCSTGGHQNILRYAGTMDEEGDMIKPVNGGEHVCVRVSVDEGGGRADDVAAVQRGGDVRVLVCDDKGGGNDYVFATSHGGEVGEIPVLVHKDNSKWTQGT